MCRVPRLRLDREGWMTKKAEEKGKVKHSMMGYIQEEEEKEVQTKEGEDGPKQRCPS